MAKYFYLESKTVREKMIKFVTSNLTNKNS